MDYLTAMRPHILQCARACQHWSFPYDGENPSAECLLESQSELTLKNVNQSGAALQNGIDRSQADVKNNDQIGATKQKEPDQSDAALQNAVQSNSSLKTDTDSSTNGAILSTSQVIKDKMDAEEKAETKQSSSLNNDQHYAESTVSEADSALSGTSNNTDSAVTTATTSTSESRTDSPLYDTFDNANFSAFLTSLNHVETPVTLGDVTLDDILRDIESAAGRYESPAKNTAVSSSSSSVIVDKTQLDTEELPKSQSSTDASNSDNKLTRFDSLLNLDNAIAAGVRASSSSSSMAADSDATAYNAVKAEAGGGGAVFTPTKYNIAKPNIGE